MRLLFFICLALVILSCETEKVSPVSTDSNNVYDSVYEYNLKIYCDGKKVIINPEGHRDTVNKYFQSYKYVGTGLQWHIETQQGGYSYVVPVNVSTVDTISDTVITKLIDHEIKISF